MALTQGVDYFSSRLLQGMCVAPTRLQLFYSVRAARRLGSKGRTLAMGLSSRLTEGSTWVRDQTAPQAALYSMMKGKLQEVGACPGSSKAASLVVLLRGSTEAATCRSDLLSGGDSLVTARLRDPTSDVNKAPRQHKKTPTLQKDQLRQWEGVQIRLGFSAARTYRQQLFLGSASW